MGLIAIIYGVCDCDYNYDYIHINDCGRNCDYGYHFDIDDFDNDYEIDCIGV